MDIHLCCSALNICSVNVLNLDYKKYAVRNMWGFDWTPAHPIWYIT